MIEEDADKWPLPVFNPGDTKALHAVGVIALTFVQFERGVESLFLHHPAQHDVSMDLLHRDFYALNEKKRARAVRKFYQDSESDPLVVKAVENVLDFFDWAHDARNKILHSEVYPPGISGRPDTFYLIKRNYGDSALNPSAFEIAN